MANLNDLIATLDNLTATLEKELPTIAAGAALTIKALAEREILDKGFGATYSTHAVANRKLRQNLLNNRGATFLDKRDKAGQTATTYADFRKAQGLQTGHVDLHYTGLLFKGMTVIKQQTEGYKYLAVLGHNDASGAKKMDANFQRYGDFIAKVIDNQDIQDVSDYVNVEIQNIIENAFK